MNKKHRKDVGRRCFKPPGTAKVCPGPQGWEAGGGLPSDSPAKDMQVSTQGPNDHSNKLP